MDAGTILAVGALLVSVGSVVAGLRRDRRTGDQGERSLNLQEDDLSLRQLTAANAALEQEVIRVDRRLKASEERVGQLEGKVAECEARERRREAEVADQEKRWQAKIDGLMTLLIRNGITP